MLDFVCSTRLPDDLRLSKYVQRIGGRSNAGKEYEMVLYQLDYILHEPSEDQGWLYMAEIPDIPGRRAWAENANAALAELSIVAEQFIISYKDRGDPMTAAIARSLNGQGRISVAI